MTQTPGLPSSQLPLTLNRSGLEVVDEYLRCVREGDRNGLRDILSAHVEVRYFGPREHLPWAGIFRGLRGFDQFAKLVVENLEVLEAAEIDRIVEGDKVVIIGRGRWRVRSTDKELRGAQHHRVHRRRWSDRGVSRAHGHGSLRRGDGLEAADSRAHGGQASCHEKAPLETRDTFRRLHDSREAKTGEVSSAV